jgi:hypothetical protein
MGQKGQKSGRGGFAIQGHTRALGDPGTPDGVRARGGQCGRPLQVTLGLLSQFCSLQTELRTSFIVENGQHRCSDLRSSRISRVRCGAPAGARPARTPPATSSGVGRAHCMLPLRGKDLECISLISVATADPTVSKRVGGLQ